MDQTENKVTVSLQNLERLRHDPHEALELGTVLVVAERREHVGREAHLGGERALTAGFTAKDVTEVNVEASPILVQHNVLEVSVAYTQQVRDEREAGARLYKLVHLTLKLIVVSLRHRRQKLMDTVLRKLFLDLHEGARIGQPL